MSECRVRIIIDGVYGLSAAVAAVAAAAAAAE